ncbi:YciI family protein [Dactylosporangium sp. NPDC051485]|uniref:YciI family protein n=1 Tax=Dactylosporangium sp. NPDC051485 TaxID=3154846 RepID=UPI00342F66DC
MRVLVMTKGAGANEEKGTPTAEMFEQMRVYNEQLVNAGIMLGGEGLQPSAKGAQVVFTETGTSVVDGPFAESKELIAGYWIWEVRSLEEAVEWAKRCPYDPRYGADQVLEIRPFYEMADFDATLVAASVDDGSPAPREDG